MATTPIAWPDWRRATHAMWWPCDPTCRCARNVGMPPYPTGRPRVVHRAPAPVAHEPLAAREQGLAAQEVRGRARLAAHGGGRSPYRLVVGRASGSWAARGTQV